jgi:hypothetical protein
MRNLIMLVLTLAAVLGAQTPVVHGPRGGCYTIVTSKTGKTYKKYVACPKPAAKAVAHA